MYRIKLEQAEILKNHKKLKDIGDIIDITEQHLCNIFNGNSKCTKILAKSLISIKENIPINSKRMENLLENYFTKE